jgi:hypothetical protein
MLLYAGLVVLAVVLIRLTVLIRPLEGEESSRQVTKRDPQVATAIQGHVFRWWMDPFLLVTASSLIMPFGGTVVILCETPRYLGRRGDAPRRRVGSPARTRFSTTRL